MVRTMGVRRTNCSRGHHGADNEVRRANPKHIDRPRKNWRESLAHNDHHTITAKHMRNIYGKHEFSDLSLSADMCAQDVQTQRSQDVRVTRVHFCDTVQTIDIIAYSEIYDQPLTKFVLGKYGTHIKISRHACAYTGLHKDELVVRRLKWPKRPLEKERSPKTDCLGDRP